MNITLWLVAGGFVFLVGFVAGARFEEGNLRLRERRLARLRRTTREGGDRYAASMNAAATSAGREKSAA